MVLMQDVEVILWPRTQGRSHDNKVGPLFIELDDLRKDFEELRSRGVELMESKPEDYPFGVRIEAVEPDDNTVCLRQRKASRGSEISLDTWNAWVEWLRIIYRQIHRSWEMWNPTVETDLDLRSKAPCCLSSSSFMFAPKKVLT